MPKIIKVPNNLFFANVGEPKAEQLANHLARRTVHALRKWENCKDYGFISAGQGQEWSNQLDRVSKNDIICAYVTERGFVGIGQCFTDIPVPILKFKTYNEEFLINKNLLQPTNILTLNSDNNNPLSEYAIGIRW